MVSTGTSRAPMWPVEFSVTAVRRKKLGFRTSTAAGSRRAGMEMFSSKMTPSVMMLWRLSAETWMCAVVETELATKPSSE